MMRQCQTWFSVVLAAAFAFGLLAAGPPRGSAAARKAYVNHAGVRMIPIPAGRFLMGNSLPTDPKMLGQLSILTDGDYDEKPAHEVRIGRDFHISETEITAEQFARFRFDYQALEEPHGAVVYATGVSWHDAVEFCRWLSRNEKKSYRLPTEAEWEYAARAGGGGHFSTGDRLPASGEANAWGVKNMHTDAAEWVLDWHGAYPAEPQIDPVGPRSGFARVVRGGGIMGVTGREEPVGWSLPYYRRSANRAGIAPGFRGRHQIGFRIVEASMPETAPGEPEAQLHTLFVKQDASRVKAGPDPRKPWFHKRTLLPVPPEDEWHDAILAVGLNPAILGHNHSGGLAVCPNGDVLATWFSSATSTTEYLPNTSFITARLRFGSERWDFPSVLYDFPDVNEQSSLLWADGNPIFHFGGGAGLTQVPFRWQTSRDNGATWSEVLFPTLLEPLGGYWPQPINSAFRGPGGAIYMASDAIGGESMLWGTLDEGKTWFDTGGRTGGRHTTLVPLKDGGILGLGGKNTNIDGFMPQSISRDGGKTWTVSKTQFPALGTNQRPVLIRLASGRLFFAGDWQDINGQRPAGVTQRGAYVALSSDEGKTWEVKTLPGTLPHESWTMPERALWKSKTGGGDGTLGYAVAAQAPNGLIHLVTSMNHPSLHFEMNEAWILSGETVETAVSFSAGRILSSKETYPDGKTKAAWSGIIEDAGRYVLDGRETWYYEDGSKQYEANWSKGVKTGQEAFRNRAGNQEWAWRHAADGSSVWTQYWPNGARKSESSWRGHRAAGPATLWAPDGKLIQRREFRDGAMAAP